MKGLNQRKNHLKSGETSGIPCLRRGLGGGLRGCQGISRRLSILKVAMNTKKVLRINKGDWIARGRLLVKWLLI